MVPQPEIEPIVPAHSPSYPRYLYWEFINLIRHCQQKLFFKLPDKEQEEFLEPIYRHLTRIMQAREENPGIYFETFHWLEGRGVHFTPNHYYYPIPDTRELVARPELFTQPSAMIGIDLNEEQQLRFIQEIFPMFAEEYNRFPLGKSPDLPPYAFYLNNGIFDGLDALVLYCMARHYKPNRILEVGSGWSTRIFAQAALVNGNTRLTCIEPYPEKLLSKGFPGLNRLITKKEEEVGLVPFEELGENDILFIDTAHVIKTNGDVNFLFLEVLPRLQKGVIVHVHDIFLPYEYWQWWITERLLFWNEQYLLQALLMFNDHFQILQAVSFMRNKHQEALRQTFPRCPFFDAGQSFWIKKIK